MLTPLLTLIAEEVEEEVCIGLHGFRTEWFEWFRKVQR